jgi:hypothetical protein
MASHVSAQDLAIERDILKYSCTRVDLPVLVRPSSSVKA